MKMKDGIEQEIIVVKIMSYYIEYYIEYYRNYITCHIGSLDRLELM